MGGGCLSQNGPLPDPSRPPGEAAHLRGFVTVNQQLLVGRMEKPAMSAQAPPPGRPPAHAQGPASHLDPGSPGFVAFHVQELIHVDLQLRDLLFLGGETRV